MRYSSPEAPLANSRTFVDHALDLLSLLGPVQARSMFGGHGLYARGVMFGLLDDDELFFKTDGETRARFVEASCRRWVYPGMAETSYYRPPDEAHEDAEAMLLWARLGLDAALRAQAVKVARAEAAGAQRKARETSAKRRPASAAARASPEAVRGPAKGGPKRTARIPAAPKPRRAGPERSRKGPRSR